MNNKLAPPKIKLSKMVCYKNNEELVEQTTPSTALTLQTGYVYVFLKEKPTYYVLFVVGGDGIDYGDYFYQNGCRMFVNPTSTGAFNNIVNFYNDDNQLVMLGSDDGTQKWGSDITLYKDFFELDF